jgi:hypothetical protein
MKIVIKLIFLILFLSCKAAKNRTISVIPSGPEFAGTIGTGIEGSGNDAFNTPEGVAVDSSGNIYAADS